MRTKNIVKNRKKPRNKYSLLEAKGERLSETVR